MDMQHINPSTMSTFHAILYSLPHLPMMFIDRHSRAERVSESVVSLLQSYGSKNRGPEPVCLFVT